MKEDKTIEAIKNPHCGWFYKADQKDFEKIADSPIGYWVGKSVLRLFKDNPLLDSVSNAVKGLDTGEDKNNGKKEF